MGKSIDMGDSIELRNDDRRSLSDLGMHYRFMDSCYAIGWSDGGINGLLFLAMRHPEKVKKLAVTGANLTSDTTAVDPWVYALG